jgi:hypothetical protein
LRRSEARYDCDWHSKKESLQNEQWWLSSGSIKKIAEEIESGVIVAPFVIEEIVICHPIYSIKKKYTMTTILEQQTITLIIKPSNSRQKILQREMARNMFLCSI